ncbi:MAG: alcohol dehydrogenase [Euryarchaeota archaeon RBG_16_68_12]|nr:MAG: alcohol dehydrogenase [Euryarchaeota archaeon RBG_16_68_12]
MKAVIFRTHGGPEVLEPVADFPEPALGPEDVLVRVRAAALNHLDLTVRQGIPTLKLPLPHILGSDVAGEVARIGDDAGGFEVGERVAVNPGLSCGECEFCVAGDESMCVDFKILGEHVNGGYAEYVAVPARNLARLPTEFPWEAAAAAPLVFLTAWRMLITRAKVRPGEDVLVLGAGSGVSTAAIQIAKLAGCTVFATSSSDEKLRRAKEIGADVLINYKAVPWSKAVWELTGKRGVDVVVDHVGAATFKDSLRSLRKGGRLVTPGATTGAVTEIDLRYVFWRQLGILGSTMASQREFEEVMKLVFMGRLKPVVDTVFPLEEARKAHEYLERGEQFGKVVLRVD